MKRRGLWAACVVLLVGLVGVLAIGAGYAKDESAPRSARRPRSTGRICSPLMELKSRAMISSRSPTPAMRSLTATAR